MDMEAVVIGAVVLTLVFFVIGKVSIQVFKVLFTIATGISVVVLVIASPFLVLFLGVKGVGSLFSKVWGWRTQAQERTERKRTVSERLFGKEE